MTFVNPYRDQVLGLARIIFQSTPKIIEQYEFEKECTPKQLRYRMKQEFWQNTHHSAPEIIERLLHKGATDYLELIEFHTQIGHLQAFMAEPPLVQEERTPSERILNPREIRNIPPMPLAQEANLN